MSIYANFLIHIYHNNFLSLNIGVTPLFKPKCSIFYNKLIIFLLNNKFVIVQLLYKMHKFPFYQKLTTLVRILTKLNIKKADILYSISTFYLVYIPSILLNSSTILKSSNVNSISSSKYSPSASNLASIPPSMLQSIRITDCLPTSLEGSSFTT